MTTAKVEALPNADLSKAYVAFFAEVQNAVKNADNPYFKSKYADLAEIIATVKPILSKYKLAVLQTPGRLVSIGGTDGAPESGASKGAGTLAISLFTQLIHESGQTLAVEMHMPVLGSVNKKSGLVEYGPQQVGSAISYARRYGLAAICGITQADDDGNAAQGKAEASEDHPAEETLSTAIEAATTVGELEALKAAVQSSGIKALGPVYVAKMRLLKNPPA